MVKTKKEGRDGEVKDLEYDSVRLIAGAQGRFTRRVINDGWTDG